MTKQESIDQTGTHPYLNHQQSIDNTYNQISPYPQNQTSITNQTNSYDKNEVRKI